MGCGGSKDDAKKPDHLGHKIEKLGDHLDKKAEHLVAKAEKELKHEVAHIQKEAENLHKQISKKIKGQFENVPRCFQKHVLSTDSDAKGWFCNYCSKSDSSSPYTCKECNFHLCNLCSSWIINYKKCLHKYMRCAQKHLTRLTPISNIFDFYEQLVGVRGVICSGCRVQFEESNGSGNMYHCRRCNYDLCEGCLNKIETCRQKEGTKCVHDHKLKWDEHDLNRFVCNKCGTDYEGIGNFNCSHCECRHCIKCAYDQNK